MRFRGRWTLSLWLLLVALLAAGEVRAQSCTHFVNATDGSDANTGTRRDQAWQSFESAVRKAPNDAILCVAAGEYVYGADDRDGVQIRLDQPKTVRLVLEPFAGASRVLFTEKEFLFDGPGATLTFESSAGVSVVFGVGETNVPANFPAHLNFLHTLSLAAGTLDFKGVPVQIDGSVGNPAFSRSFDGIVRQAPATAAIRRGTGFLLATNLAFTPAPRTIIYEGRGDRTTGAELPLNLQSGSIFFDHSEGTLTFSSPLGSPNVRLVQRGSGSTRVQTPLTLAPAEPPAIESLPESAGTLSFEAPLTLVAPSGSSTAVRHQGAGVLSFAELRLRLPDGVTGGSHGTTVEVTGPGTLAVRALSAPPNGSGTTVAARLTAGSGGRLALGDATATPILPASLTAADGSTVVLAGDVRLEGRLDLIGRLELGARTLTLAGAPEHRLSGSITADAPGAMIVAAGTTRLTGGTSLPGLSAASGVVTLEIPAAHGVLSVAPGAELVASAPMSARQLSIAGGTFTIAADAMTVGTLFQQPLGTLRLGTAALTIEGDATFGPAIEVDGGSILFGGDGVQVVRAVDPVALPAIVVRGGSIITFSEAEISATENVSIEQGGELALERSELRLVGDGALLTNEGRYRADADSRIVFADPQPGAQPQAIIGAGRFGSLTAALASPDDRVVLRSDLQLEAGTLAFARGSLDLGGHRLLLPTDTLAVLERTLAGTPAGGFVTGEGTFNPTGAGYVLRYVGDLSEPQSPGTELGAPEVHRLEIATTDLTGRGGLVLANDLRFGGELQIYRGGLLILSGRTLDLTAADARHVVDGRIAASGEGRLLLSGTGTILAMGAPAGVRTIEALVVGTAGTVRIEGLRRLGGGTGLNEGLTILSGTTALALGATASGEAGSVSQLRQTGGSIHLHDDARITTRLQTTGGLFCVGDADLLMGRGSLLDIRAPAGFCDPEGHAGSIVFEYAASIRSGTVGLPGLRVALAAGDTLRLAGSVRVNGHFEHVGGTVDLADQILLLRGGRWSLGGAAPTPPAYTERGTIQVLDTVRVDPIDAVELPALRIGGIATPGHLSVITADTAATGVLTIRRALTVEKGTLDLGRHQARLVGSEAVLHLGTGKIRGHAPEPFSTPSSGLLTLAGPGPARIVVAGAARIDNLAIRTTTSLDPTSEQLRIGHSLDFGSSSVLLPSDDRIVLADGARIIRRDEGILSRRLAFDGVVDVYYLAHGVELGDDGLLLTATELPGSSGVLRDLVVDVGRDPAGRINTLRLLKPVHVTGTLLLRSGLLDLQSNGIALASGALLEVDYVRSAPPALQRRERLTAEGSVDVVLRGRMGTFSAADFIAPEFQVGLLRTEMGSDREAHQLHLGRDLVVEHLEVAHRTPSSALLLDGRELTVRETAHLLSGTIASGAPARLRLLGDLFLEGAEVAPTVSVIAGGTDQTVTVVPKDRDDLAPDARLPLLSLEMVSAGSRRAPPSLALATADSAANVVLAVDSLVLRHGIVVTGDHELELPGSRPGFSYHPDRTETSHVVGTVARQLDGASVPAELVFPVGTPTRYRPLRLSKLAGLPTTGVRLRASHTGEAPSTDGLPVDGGEVTLHGTADFYWTLGAEPQVELRAAVTVSATGFTLYDPAHVERLRLLEGTPRAPWTLLGAPGGYANTRVDVPHPGTPVVTADAANLALGASPRWLTLGVEAAYAAYAELQLLNAAVDAGMPPVDVYLDDALLARSLAPGSGTPFLRIPPGDHVVTLVSTEGNAVASTTVDAVSRARAQLVAGGYTPGGPDAARDPERSMRLFDNPAPPMPLGADAPAAPPISFFHGVADDVTLQLLAERHGFLGEEVLAFGDFAPRVLPLPAGAVNLIVRSADRPGHNLGAYHLDPSRLPESGGTLLYVGFNPDAARLLFVDTEGESVRLGAVAVATDEQDALPTRLVLHGNYPNPFNPATTIRFDLPAASAVELRVYDVTGREVLALPPQAFGAGADRRIALDASSLPSGVYLYRLTARASAGGVQEASGRFVLVK